MGINKTNDEFDRYKSTNGHDPIYDSPNWRYYILNKRPANVSAKRVVMFFSFDVIAIWAILGIIDKLTTTKEIVVLFVGIAYVVVRLAIGIVKLFSFVGRNHEGIRKGIRSIRELFNE